LAPALSNTHCTTALPCYNKYVTTQEQEKVDFLIEQATELPEEAQAELVDSLIEMRSQALGVYRFNEDERAALARSAEDIRLDRFASQAEADELFARYGA